MSTDQSQSGDYRVVVVPECLGAESKLIAAAREVEALLKDGARCIALLFECKKTPFSRLLSFLSQCSEMVRERGGRLAAVVPDPDLYETMTDMGYAKLVWLVSSLEELSKTRD
jgi:hypothetical protein